jgi:flagellar biosynthesis protein FlhF
MDVKHYRGHTVREAIERAKRELGPDARILQVRRIDPFTPGADPRLGDTEVVAIDDSGAMAHQPVGSANGSVVRRSSTPGPSGRQPLLRQPFVQTDRFETLPQAQAHLQHTSNGPAPQSLRAHFRRIGMEEHIIDQIVTFPDRTPLPMQRGHFRKIIDRLVPTGATIPPAGRVVVSLVGPTGVGKTTTIAKLGAHFAEIGRPVSLVTTDTFRVGAVEQLDTFARLIDAPLRIVYSRADFVAALDASHDAEVILIDTPGVSPYDAAMLQELRALVGYKDRVLCYLTLSASADPYESVEAAKRFALINPIALILTKLDETRRYGSMVNVASECSLPLGYLATGPSVPDDLHAATPELLRDFIMPNEWVMNVGGVA